MQVLFHNAKAVSGSNGTVAAQYAAAYYHVMIDDEAQYVSTIRQHHDPECQVRQRGTVATGYEPGQNLCSVESAS